MVVWWSWRMAIHWSKLPRNGATVPYGTLMTAPGEHRIYAGLTGSWLQPKAVKYLCEILSVFLVGIKTTAAHLCLFLLSTSHLWLFHTELPIRHSEGCSPWKLARLLSWMHRQQSCCCLALPELGGKKPTCTHSQTSPYKKAAGFVCGWSHRPWAEVVLVCCVVSAESLECGGGGQILQNDLFLAELAQKALKPLFALGNCQA